MSVNPEAVVAINNPGSYNDYLKAHEIEGDSLAPEKYSEALNVYRLALAAELGIKLEDLHDRRFDYRADEQAA